jgi:hypothetical protein
MIGLKRLTGAAMLATALVLLDRFGSNQSEDADPHPLCTLRGRSVFPGQRLPRPIREGTVALGIS